MLDIALPIVDNAFPVISRFQSPEHAAKSESQKTSALVVTARTGLTTGHRNLLDWCNRKRDFSLKNMDAGKKANLNGSLRLPDAKAAK